MTGASLAADLGRGSAPGQWTIGILDPMFLELDSKKTFL